MPATTSAKTRRRCGEDVLIANFGDVDKSSSRRLVMYSARRGAAARCRRGGGGGGGGGGESNDFTLQIALLFEDPPHPLPASGKIFTVSKKMRSPSCGGSPSPSHDS